MTKRRYFDIEGKKYSIADIMEKTGVSYSCARDRGIDFENGYISAKDVFIKRKKREEMVAITKRGKVYDKYELAKETGLAVTTCYTRISKHRAGKINDLQLVRDYDTTQKCRIARMEKRRFDTPYGLKTVREVYEKFDGLIGIMTVRDRLIRYELGKIPFSAVGLPPRKGFTDTWAARDESIGNLEWEQNRL